jgi:hypothetical protein
MTKKYLPILILLLFCKLPARAGFNFDANCIEAYNAIFSLKINDAKTLIQKEKQQDPHNGIIILLENYVDYFSLLTSENRADYEKWKDNKSTRISALEDNDRSSPWYLFSQAEVYLQWSLLKAKFGDYMSSSLDTKKANGLLNDNTKKYPDFLPNQKSIALVNIIFGSIPANLKGITRFLGMSGNVQTGMKQLESLRVALPKTKYSFYSSEVVFFISTVDVNTLHNANDYQKLEGYLNEMEPGSLLKAYLQGYVAVKTAHNDDAIAFLEAVPKSNQYIKFSAIDYQMGCAKLNKLDNDAPAALNAYLKDYRGESYIKDTYLRLAYFYLLQNDQERYANYLKLVKSRGYTIDGRDKLALSEANDLKPDIDLLKARFYFDGGYYDKAFAVLAGRDGNAIRLLRDKTEYYYRLGRVLDRTGKYNDAIASYQRAISLGKDTHYYYAANAALNTGRIYEERHDYKKAADYYNQALAMRDHQYQDDIDNDAKAGLKRIGG